MSIFHRRLHQSFGEAIIDEFGIFLELESPKIFATLIPRDEMVLL
jgi:hypothetical protein